MFELSGTHKLDIVVLYAHYGIFSLVSSGNDVKGSEKRRTPSV